MNTNSLFSVKLQKSRLRDVLPPSFIGRNVQTRQKALALLGDRLIDLKLYEQLLLKGEKNEGFMTQTRSMMVANSNLARCGELLVVPYIISEKAYSALSLHERGTVVEAYVGALYEQNHYRITQELSIVLETMISLLETFLGESSSFEKLDSAGKEFQCPGSVSNSNSYFTHQKSLKKAKSTFLEIMQRKGITNASTFFHSRGTGHNPLHPPFIATFEAKLDLTTVGLPNVGKVTSKESDSKKEAEEDCASKVLKLFQSDESCNAGHSVDSDHLLSRQKRKAREGYCRRKLKHPKDSFVS